MADQKNLSQELFERIDKYVLGELSPTERHAFEKEMLEDSILLQHVNEHKYLVEHIEKQALRDKLDDYHKTIASSSSSKGLPLKHGFNWRYGVAASIVLLMGLFAVWQLSPSLNNERLYSKHYEPDPGLPTVMGSGEHYEFYDAMVSYKHGDYEIAIAKWEAQNKRRSSDTLNFFLGSAYLAKEDAKASIPYFKRVMEESSSIFINEAYFYLGLAFLKNRDEKSAIEVLKKSDSEKCRLLLLELND